MGASPINQENRVLPLVSLRFLLAVWIFVHHLYPVWWMPLTHRVGSFLYGFAVMGYVAVPFFFVLSGYVLTLAYGSDRLMTAKERKRFWCRRFARIAPAFYAGLLLGLFPYTGMVMKHVDTSLGVLLGTAKDLLINMSFLGVFSDRALVMNYSSWTISVEALLYAAFPFVAHHVFRLGKRGLILTMFLCIAACVAIELCVMAKVPELYSWRANQFRPEPPLPEYADRWRIFMLTCPPLHFLEFAIGVCLARFNAIVGFVKPRADLWLTVCGASFATGILFLGQMPYLFPFNWVFLPAMAATIFLLTNARGRISNWLSDPRLLRFGEASYVLYILHTPTRDWVSFLMGHFGLRGTYAQYFIGFAFAPLFVIAALPLHYYVNIPVTRALYRFLKARFLDSPERAAPPRPEAVREQISA
jgi:peptidoglycan/LPS O-acetylase OafA/YrhL